jgi:hypothetical protein
VRVQLSRKRLLGWKYLMGHLVHRLFDDDGGDTVVVEPIAHQDLPSGRAFQFRCDNGQEFWLMEYQVRVLPDELSAQQADELDAIFDEP